VMIIIGSEFRVWGVREEAFGSSASLGMTERFGRQGERARERERESARARERAREREEI